VVEVEVNQHHLLTQYLFLYSHLNKQEEQEKRRTVGLAAAGTGLTNAGREETGAGNIAWWFMIVETCFFYFTFDHTLWLYAFEDTRATPPNLPPLRRSPLRHLSSSSHASPLL
jgi:hypothetical protein